MTNKTNARPDDFRDKRKHLEAMSDEELRKYFWQLAERAVAPLIGLARETRAPVDFGDDRHVDRGLAREFDIVAGLDSLEFRLDLLGILSKIPIREATPNTYNSSWTVSSGSGKTSESYFSKCFMSISPYSLFRV